MQVYLDWHRVSYLLNEWLQVLWFDNDLGYVEVEFKLFAAHADEGTQNLSSYMVSSKLEKTIMEIINNEPFLLWYKFFCISHIVLSETKFNWKGMRWVTAMYQTPNFTFVLWIGHMFFYFIWQLLKICKKLFTYSNTSFKGHLCEF